MPTLADVIPGFDLITLIGIYARTGTPPAIVQKIATEAVASVKQPDVVPLRFTTVTTSQIGAFLRIITHARLRCLSSRLSVTPR